jgi:acid phosphatase (class A)
LGWALALAEVDPVATRCASSRAVAAYGESRLVCNVHWQSDIIERPFSAASVALAGALDGGISCVTIEAARKELAEARTKQMAPSRDCAAEAEALTQKIPGVL